MKIEKIIEVLLKKIIRNNNKNRENNIEEKASEITEKIEKNNLSIEDIKDKLKRKATIFETGGQKPTNELLESWIGSVCWQESKEEIPKDNNGNDMKPLATIFLKDLPYCHDALKDFNLMTIFMSENIFDNLSDNELIKYFCIKTYKSLEKLEKCNYTSDMIKAFPIYPKLVENEYPIADGGYDILVDDEDYDYYEEIFEGNYSKHKIGGYPSFCQCFDDTDDLIKDGYYFVLQISSDEKARFNIVDSGNFYFYYNPSIKKWKVFCDFY